MLCDTRWGGIPGRLPDQKHAGPNVVDLSTLARVTYFVRYPQEKNTAFSIFSYLGYLVEKPWQYIGDVWFGNVAATSTSMSKDRVMGNRIPSRRLPHFRNWNHHLSLMHSNTQFLINVFALNLEYFVEYNFKFDLWIWEDTHPDVYSCHVYSHLTLYTTRGRFERFVRGAWWHSPWGGMGWIRWGSSQVSMLWFFTFYHCRSPLNHH